LIASAETVEAAFMYQYVSKAPPSVARALGITSARIGGGVVLSMRNDPTDYWNKALGFGFSEPVSAVLIDEVIDFYRARDIPKTVIQIAPAALPADWHDICRRHDLRRGTVSLKLACHADEFHPTRHTGLRVGRVTPQEIGLWATTTLRGFQMPTDHLADMLESSASDPAFRPFAAWDRAEMVATGNLLVQGDVASLNSGATLPSHQNRGAQSALIALRGEEALKARCTWLVAEAAKPAEDESNPSLNNLKRAGLRLQYERCDWVSYSDGAERPAPSR
jgi:hypothetical protein